MNQCVPRWEVDDNPTPPKLNIRAHPNSISLGTDVPTLDYEVAELTWENGQLAMHGLGPPRVPNKPPATSTTTKYTWDKPRAGGTLESIVNQATTLLPHLKTAADRGVGGYSLDELVPWFDHHRTVGGGTNAAASATMTMDALVPSSNNNNNNNNNRSDEQSSGFGTCGVGCSTRVGSCSGLEGGRLARAAHEWSSCRDQSVSGSATSSHQVTLDTCEMGLGVGGFTSTSIGSLGNTSSGKQCTKSVTGDDHDSVCHSRPKRETGGEGDKKKAKGKYSVSNKRSRAAAIHNQSERKRRDKINQKMKTLQKLVPNSSKTDKASMLDEVIEYLKQLQAQIQMMSRMNMSPMMLPMALQQQLQMSMMAPMMGMGMGMGMGVMDINSMARPNLAPLLHPTAFMSLAPWESAPDRLPTPASVMPDPLSTFLACQSQPITMDAYTRMAALYQQMHQPPGPSKN